MHGSITLLNLSFLRFGSPSVLSLFNRLKFLDDLNNLNVLNFLSYGYQPPPRAR
jgi:hypothetical protein